MATIGIKSRVYAVVNIKHPAIARAYMFSQDTMKLTVCRDNRFHSNDSDEPLDTVERIKQTAKAYKEANPDMKFGATVTVEISP